MGRTPVGKVAMTSAERQRLYMQRLKDKAAANAKQPGPRQIVTDGMTGARWRRSAGQARAPTSRPHSNELRA